VIDVLLITRRSQVQILRSSPTARPLPTRE
jgi:hypothetical protein